MTDDPRRDAMERIVALGKGDKGDQGARGERGIRGLSVVQGRAVVFLFLMSLFERTLSRYYLKLLLSSCKIIFLYVCYF